VGERIARCAVERANASDTKAAMREEVSECDHPIAVRAPVVVVVVRVLFERDVPRVVDGRTEDGDRRLSARLVWLAEKAPNSRALRSLLAPAHSYTLPFCPGSLEPEQGSAQSVACGHRLLPHFTHTTIHDTSASRMHSRHSPHFGSAFIE